jgi:hypothetical protein
VALNIVGVTLKELVRREKGVMQWGVMLKGEYGDDDDWIDGDRGATRRW